MKKTILLCSAAALSLGVASGAAAQDGEHEHTDDEIIVTGSPLAHPEHESIIGASVLTEDEIAQRATSSIGELLRQEPGVSSTFFGPAASRPIIRGLGGDRISVLDAGIGSIDASSVSDDHAVAVEPAQAKRIEIVRGAASLYYGSSAAGGAVNIFDGRIPDETPEGGVDGALRTSLASVDDSVEAAGGFDVLLGKIGGADFVFHGEGVYRNTDDYNIPGFARSSVLRDSEPLGAGESEPEGTVINSALESKGGGVGASLIFDDGFFGAAVKKTRARYGVPGDEEDVSINLQQDRFDLMGELDRDFLIFQTAKIRFGYADYQHQELEGTEIGTTFLNEGYEGRVELVEKHIGNFNSADGFQFKHRNFSALGDEAFTPPSVTDQFGVFTVREYETDGWHIQIAGRFEHTSIEAPTLDVTRNFNSYSVSGGAGFEPADNWFIGVNGFRTERAPAPEELFSDGPHLATNAYEIGDPTLGKETALGVEATLHAELGPVTAALNGFYTNYDDFVALIPNGAEIDGLPAFNFEARDADYRGFEAQAEADLFSPGPFDVAGRVQVDYVRASFDAGDAPRIPPLRSIFGLEATSDYVDLSAEVELAAKQNKIAAYESPTDGYALVNLGAVWRPGGAGHGLSVQLHAENVTNEEARLHTSFLKEVAPLPGRNFKVVLRGEF